MNTISLKLPDRLLTEINCEAEERRLSRSEVIRERLEAAMATKSPSLWDRMKDLVIDDRRLPRDLSSNPKYARRSRRRLTPA